MANIVVCSLGFRGHVNPMLALVKALVLRGHQVKFFCTESIALDVQKTGAEFIPYQSLFDEKFEMPKTDVVAHYLIRSVTEAHHVLPQLLSVVNTEQIDVILYEGACLAGRLLSQILKIPAVKLAPSFATTEKYSPFFEGRKSFFQNSKMVDLFNAEVEKLKQDYQIDYSLQENVGHAEDLNIVCMPRIFHPQHELFDERFVFIGPAMIEEADDVEQMNDPLLYISLGTLQNNQPRFYEKCFQAFGDTDWRVIMPVGDKIDRSQWNIPDNFKVADFVAQNAVLQRAKIFITVGGMNSVQQSLYHGVPMIVIPETGEHEVIAQQVVGLGLGVSLNKDNISAVELKKAVDAIVTSEDYYHRCKEFAALSRAAGGVVTAAMAIERMMT